MNLEVPTTLVFTKTCSEYICTAVAGHVVQCVFSSVGGCLLILRPDICIYDSWGLFLQKTRNHLLVGNF
jgi:hypothetical protein